MNHLFATLYSDLKRSANAPPGGESRAEFHARCGEAWAWVLAQYAALGGPLAVVSHGPEIKRGRLELGRLE